MTEYITRDGDAIDAICYQQYGQEHGTSELVLEHNPRLAAHGAVLPAGITILLPDIVTNSPILETVELWD